MPRVDLIEDRTVNAGAEYIVKAEGENQFAVVVKAKTKIIVKDELFSSISPPKENWIKGVLLTNGVDFHFYKIEITNKPNYELIFKLSLKNITDVEYASNFIPFITKSAVIKGGIEALLNQARALSTDAILNAIVQPKIVASIMEFLNKVFATKHDDSIIKKAITDNVCEKILKK